MADTLSAMSSSTSSTPQTETITGFVSGDPSAFSELHEQFGPDVLSFLAARLGNTASAEDVHQETWLKVWHSRESYSHDSFRGWVFQIARNTLIDHVRKAKKQSATEIDENRTPGGLDDPSIDAVRQEELRVLQECLRDVGGPFVEAFFLVKFEGQTATDVADQLNLPRQTVDTRVHRGKQLVMHCVKEKLK